MTTVGAHVLQSAATWVGCVWSCVLQSAAMWVGCVWSCVFTVSCNVGGLCMKLCLYSQLQHGWALCEVCKSITSWNVMLISAWNVRNTRFSQQLLSHVISWEVRLVQTRSPRLTLSHVGLTLSHVGLTLSHVGITLSNVVISASVYHVHLLHPV